MQVFNHVISKRSRRRIVEILAATRSMRGLAEEIGVSPAAIHKYITGKTHPSDEVVKRMIELADYEETRKIAEAILDDLSTALDEFILWALEKDVLTNRDLDRLEASINKARLVLRGRGRLKLLA